MTPRSLVPVAMTFLVLGGGWPAAARSQAHPTRTTEANAARGRPAPPDADLLSIRNIFRYADEPGLETGMPRPEPAPQRAPRERPPLPTSDVRIIGLVHRAGAPVAALVIDGEVVLLREGETRAGLTVLGIRGETVHLRDLEGDEMTLQLP